MTRRRQIINLLEKQEMTAQQLANHFGLEMGWILDDLNHIKKSIRPKRLHLEPSYCRYCGFVFKERSRFSKPSKCPECKTHDVCPPRLRIN